VIINVHILQSKQTLFEALDIQTVTFQSILLNTEMVIKYEPLQEVKRCKY